MGWSDEDVEEQKKRLEREITKRVKRGEIFEVLPAPGGQKKLCTTFWGQAWCRNLESYQVYESRLPRGRSYLRQGKVYNLEITPGKLSAVVAGSELYDASISIAPLPDYQWREIVQSSAGQVHSILDLLSGKLGDGLMKVLTDPHDGLFPKPKEIRFNCSCPDYADMCKHVSAILYGVGVMLDRQPELLFTLRGVDQAELLSEASSTTLDELDPGNELGAMDLSELFGIDLGELPSVELTAPAPVKQKASSKKATTRKLAEKKKPASKLPTET